QADHALAVALLVGRLKPTKGCVFVSKLRIQRCNLVRGDIAALPLRQSHLNAFGNSALPASGTIALLHSCSKIGVVPVSIKLGVSFPLFDGLGVHAFSPIGLG